MTAPSQKAPRLSYVPIIILIGLFVLPFLLFPWAVKVAVYIAWLFGRYFAWVLG